MDFSRLFWLLEPVMGQEINHTAGSDYNVRLNLLLHVLQMKSRFPECSMTHLHPSLTPIVGAPSLYNRTTTASHITAASKQIALKILHEHTKHFNVLYSPHRSLSLCPAFHTNFYVSWSLILPRILLFLLWPLACSSGGLDNQPCLMVHSPLTLQDR